MRPRISLHLPARSWTIMAAPSSAWHALLPAASPLEHAPHPLPLLPSACLLQSILKKPGASAVPGRLKRRVSFPSPLEIDTTALPLPTTGPEHAPASSAAAAAAAPMPLEHAPHHAPAAALPSAAAVTERAGGLDQQAAAGSQGAAQRSAAALPEDLAGLGGGWDVVTGEVGGGSCWCACQAGPNAGVLKHIACHQGVGPGLPVPRTLCCAALAFYRRAG